MLKLSYITDMILKPYYYLFYRIYKRQRTKFGEFESLFVACTAPSIIMFLNLYSIEILFEKLHLLPVSLISEKFIIIFLPVLIAINLLFFYSKGRYKKIEALFESHEKVVFGLGWIIIYVIFSFIAFFYIVNLK
jgi:hypothetical protein